MRFATASGSIPLVLKRALARVLDDFGAYAGRSSRRGGELWIEHGASVAFERWESPLSSHALGTAARATHIDLVCPRLSTLGAMLLLRAWALAYRDLPYDRLSWEQIAEIQRAAAGETPVSLSDAVCAHLLW